LPYMIRIYMEDSVYFIGTAKIYTPNSQNISHAKKKLSLYSTTFL
jgi:hypothetical protein